MYFIMFLLIDSRYGPLYGDGSTFLHSCLKENKDIYERSLRGFTHITLVTVLVSSPSEAFLRIIFTSQVRKSNLKKVK